MSLETDNGRIGTTRTTASAPPPAESAGRDAFFDNAKFLAILLVGIGHVIGPLWEFRPAGALNLVIYSLHMPAFILMAGYFSKNFDFSQRKIQRLITGVVVPYLAFEIIYTVLKMGTSGHRVDWSLLDPIWLNWFLAALFIWRLTSPIWKWIRWPFAISVVVCLAANLSTFPGTMALTRVLLMLPFFVLGMVLRPEHFAMLSRIWVRVLAVVLLVVAYAGAVVVRPHVSTRLLYWNDTATDLGTPYLEATVLRFALLVGSLLMVGAFLALVPRRRTWFTALGAGTIYAYLLHGIFHRVAEHFGVYDHLASPLGFAAVVIVVAALMVALMTPPVRKATRWLVEPRMNWIFRNTGTPAAAPSPAPAGTAPPPAGTVPAPTGTEHTPH